MRFKITATIIIGILLGTLIGLVVSVLVINEFLL